VAEEIAQRDDAFLLNQFASPDNALCHYETTAIEVLEQQPDVDAFVCGLGTSGTAMGVGRRLKEHNRNLKLVVAEPRSGENLQGLRSLACRTPVLEGGELVQSFLGRGLHGPPLS
jgi:cysteine synthase